MSRLNANLLLVFVALIWGSAFVTQRFAQATDAAVLAGMPSVQWLPLVPVLSRRAATGRGRPPGAKSSETMGPTTPGVGKETRHKPVIFHTPLL